MKAYEDCLQATSTHHAPWYVVPADDKENARLIVSQIVLDALGGLKMAYPKTTAKRRARIAIDQEAAGEITPETHRMQAQAKPKSQSPYRAMYSCGEMERNSQYGHHRTPHQS